MYVDRSVVDRPGKMYTQRAIGVVLFSRGDTPSTQRRIDGINLGSTGIYSVISLNIYSVKLSFHFAIVKLRLSAVIFPVVLASTLATRGRAAHMGALLKP